MPPTATLGLRSRVMLPGVASLLAALLLASCGSSPGTPTTTNRPAASTSTISSTSTSASTTTTSTTVPPATTTTTSPAAALAAAKEQWQQGAAAISAVQSGYWTRAAADLSGAAAADPSGTPGYTAAAAELDQLTTVPETSQTATQMAEVTQDTSSLNTFFGTPGLYS